VVAVARAARASGASRIGVVSAMGADPKSKIFYSRVKGEMEEAVAGLGYTSCVFARPAMLTGNRVALGQPERLGEKLGLALTRGLQPIIPKNYRSISCKSVAKSLVKHVHLGKSGVRVLLSGEMLQAVV